MCKQAMTSVRTYLILFIFINDTIPSIDGLFYKHVPLISAVHEYFGTSSVIFLRFDQERDLEAYTEAYSMIRQFSQRGIIAAVTHYDKVANRMNKYYDEGVKRPVVVAILKTVAAVHSFPDAVRRMLVSYPIWLIIFEIDSDPSVCEYCNNPSSNIFNIFLNTEMIVVCCGNPILKEWWAVRGNKTEIAVFGRWSDTNGLEVTATDSLYSRRPTINGIGFRLALVTNSVFYTGEGCSIGGLFGAVLSELKKSMNFEISDVIKADTFGTWDSVEQEWSGVVKLIVQGEADLGISEFSFTSERLASVDFTLPLILTQTKLYFRQVDASGVQWLAHFKAFHYRVWIATMLLIIISAILVAFTKMKTKIHLFVHFLSESFFAIWSAVLGQGANGFPDETPLKIIHFSMLLLTLILMNIYSASLISFLTVSDANSPFSSIEEFVNDGSYGLIAMRDSSELQTLETAKDPALSKMKNLLRPYEYLPRNLVEGFEQICDHDKKLGLLVDEALLKILNITLPCKIVEIGTGRIDSLGMILPPYSHYTDIVNHHVRRFEENGLLKRLKDIYLTEPFIPESTYTVVSLWGVAPIMSILAVGIILALMLFCCENFFAKTRRRMSFRDNEISAEIMTSRMVIRRYS